MTWARERRVIAFLIIGAILAVVAAGLYYVLFYQAPTCTDGIKNGPETAVDRGGTCPYLDNAELEPPTILFTQAILNGEGRTDVISLVENKNQTAAAKDIPYAISIFGYDQTLIQRVTGSLDLPPGASVPVFVPGVASGRATPGAAFLSITSTSTIQWYAEPSDPRIVPSVTGVTLSGTADAPRITATLGNPDVRPMRGVKVIVIVHDAQGNAVAASQTIVPIIPAQGSAIATFTWNAAFKAAPVQIKVLPIIPLPAPTGLPAAR